MKQLWNRIVTCKDEECNVDHGIVSTYVLSRYSKGKDQVCPVCGPVQDATIRLMNDDESDIVQLVTYGKGSGILLTPDTTAAESAASGEIPKRKREQKDIEVWEDATKTARKRSTVPRKFHKRNAKTFKRGTITKAKMRGTKENVESIYQILLDINSTVEGQLPSSQVTPSPTVGTWFIHGLDTPYHTEGASIDIDPGNVLTWSEDMVSEMIDLDTLDFFAFAVGGGMLTDEQCDRMLAMDQEKLASREQDLISYGNEIDRDFGAITSW